MAKTDTETKRKAGTTASTDIAQVRNFSIIAHVDHGKSTLADRLLELCHAVSAREMTDCLLDSMDIERERGITIKSQTARLNYTSADGTQYVLNLMDTPGHVDFSYEVSRSLAACEGAILLVDASQGVEAQTLANVYLALENDLELIPVLNKVDLPSAEPDRVRTDIEDIIGIDASEALEISGKSGKGVPDLLETLVNLVPPPEDRREHPLRALLVDSWYDSYLGVVMLVRVYDGEIRPGMRFRLWATGAEALVDSVGYFTPKQVQQPELLSGEIGYIISGIKDINQCRIGDTVTDKFVQPESPLPGFRPAVPVVFCGLFPADSDDFPHLRDSMKKLALNDAGIHFEEENSLALGLGYRCGFLGLLHMEITQERLLREFDLDLITTAPSVVYRMNYKPPESELGEVEIVNPADFPDPVKIESMKEPWIHATIFTPESYVGGVIELCTSKRAEEIELNWSGQRGIVTCLLPLNETVFDFYDSLKSVSRGYASFDYRFEDYRLGDLVKLQILINGDPVEALSLIVHRSRAEARGRSICASLKELIPRQLYKVALQAAIGGKVIARETVAALRKDVTAKCYGGDVTRKRKLLEKQKAGKKRMRQFGKIDIPQSVFLEALKVKDK